MLPNSICLECASPSYLFIKAPYFTLQSQTLAPPPMITSAAELLKFIILESRNFYTKKSVVMIYLNI